MTKARFKEEQIIAILREHEAGVATADVRRKHGISSATLFKWKAKRCVPGNLGVNRHRWRQSWFFQVLNGDGVGRRRRRRASSRRACVRARP